MKNKILFSVLFAFIYVGIGTYDLLSEGKLSNKLDGIIDELDFYLVFPSHMIGSLFWWQFGGAAPDEIYWALVGQFIAFLIFTLIFYLALSLILSVKKMIVPK